jgi:hypothetical protein
MKHQKIKLVLSSIQYFPNETSKNQISTIVKKNEKFFLTISSFFKFFRKSHFFQESSISACRPYDFLNPLIESYKNKNFKFYPTAVYLWGHLIIDYIRSIKIYTKFIHL